MCAFLESAALGHTPSGKWRRVLPVRRRPFLPVGRRPASSIIRKTADKYDRTRPPRKGRWRCRCRRLGLDHPGCRSRLAETAPCPRRVCDAHATILRDLRKVATKAQRLVSSPRGGWSKLSGWRERYRPRTFYPARLWGPVWGRILKIRNKCMLYQTLRMYPWRREWDSNPRYGFPHTRFPSVRLKPLGHLSRGPSLEGARKLLQGTPASRRAISTIY
jgi:hypothetical protein